MLPRGNHTIMLIAEVNAVTRLSELHGLKGPVRVTLVVMNTGFWFLKGCGNYTIAQFTDTYCHIVMKLEIPGS